MKIFSKIVLFFTVCLFAESSGATVTATVTSPIDLGTVKITDTSQQAQLRLRTSDSKTVCTKNCTPQGGSHGSILFTSDEPNVGKLTIDPFGRTFYITSCSPSISSVSIQWTMQSKSSVTYYDEPVSMIIGANFIYLPSKKFTGTEYRCSGNANVSFKHGSDVVASVSLPITIRIVSELPPIIVSKTQDMNFGQVSSNQSHDVTINPNGCGISSTYPAGIISASGAKCGIFTLKNEGSSAQALTSVTLPSSVTLSGSNGGTMSLDITSYPAVSSITSVPASTTTSVNVGGTLHVLSSNVAGTYTGNYTITVNY